MHALVFTDLVDSTALVQRLGDAAASRLWADHDARARALLAQHGGREIDRSDGFFLLFPDLPSAAAFVLGYHDACAALGVAARVGLHAGEVALRANAPADVARGAKPLEVDGLAKPVAARVMALAAGGQTLLTAAARSGLQGAADVVFEDHGHWRFKGIEDPLQVYELARPGRAMVPPPDGDKAHRVVRVADLWQPLRRVRTNLPPERDRFVGRAGELQQLAARLDAGAHLVTLTGTGGTGKTRLARRYGRVWLGDWPGGVHFCDLSEARGVDGICFAVAMALGVPLAKGDAVEQLGHAIAALGRCLVILDNVEQVVAPAADTLGRWLDRAGEAAFVATSRERLQVAGEEVMALEPLDLDSDALALFEVRARAQLPTFRLGDDNRRTVAQVVRLLDGLPLAIELAAARVRVLSPDQLVARLRDRFALLSGARGSVARQATLKAAIDWSWELLAPWEQSALAQCAAFEGSFRLEAAEAVIDLREWPQAPPSLDVVQALVDKSLLRAWVPHDRDTRVDIAEPYFGLYVSIHEYAAARLRTGSWASAAHVEARHGLHYAACGDDDALEALATADGASRRRRLALDLDNLVGASRRAVERGDGSVAVRCCRAAWEVLEQQGPFGAAVQLAEQVAAMATLTRPQRAAAQLVLGQATRRAGRPEAARACLESACDLAAGSGSQLLQALAALALAALEREGARYEQARVALDAAALLFDSIGLRRGAAQTLHERANCDKEQSRVETAERGYLDALALFREVGDPRGIALALAGLGLLCSERGRMDESLRHYEAALAAHGEAGNRTEYGLVLGNMAIVHLDRGRHEEAWARFAESLSITRSVGNRRYEGFVLNNMSLVRAVQGRIAEAADLAGQALAVHREVGNRRSAGITLTNLCAFHGHLGRTAEAQACAAEALPLHRELGNRRSEALLLGVLAQMHLDAGRLDEAAREVVEPERIAREIGDRVTLGQVLITRAKVQWAQGLLQSARETLDELEALAGEVGAAPGSNLHKGIEELRATMR